MGGIKKISHTSEEANASARKRDHIDMALDSQLAGIENDPRFYYEPMLSGHPQNAYPPLEFLGKTFRYPMWVSSMTGGTELAGKINQNLAKACNEFGLGMGLGSCRQLLYDDTYLSDFQLRKYIGDQALYANLGISQVERLVLSNKWDIIQDLLNKLEADGLIIHINPLQEWLQPEGDKILNPPIETIDRLLDKVKFPVIVKEVGQGMGPESLKALLKLPLAAIDFAAMGGTNFSKLELLRQQEKGEEYVPLIKVGHTALEMTNILNQIVTENPNEINCKQIIISGGIKDFLDGYYLIKHSKLPAIYGLASKLLKHARNDYESLQQYLTSQTEGLLMANSFLTVKN